MVFGLAKKITLLGVPLHSVPEDDFEPFILNLAGSPEMKNAVILDFKQFMKERRKIKKGKSLLKDADFIFTTSKTVAKGAAKLYGANSVRFYPFALIINTLGILEKKSLSVYLLGGRSAELQKVSSNVRSSFPELKIVGRYKGFFNSEDEQSVSVAIRKAGAAFLFVGTGVKKGAEWLAQSKKKLGGGLALYSPEAFKIMSGAEKPKSEELWLKRGSISFFSFLLPWNGLSYLHFSFLIFAEKRRQNK